MASGYVNIPSLGGVNSLNGLTGALTLAAGTNITITPSGGNTLTIAASGAGVGMAIGSPVAGSTGTPVLFVNGGNLAQNSTFLFTSGTNTLNLLNLTPVVNSIADSTAGSDLIIQGGSKSAGDGGGGDLYLRSGTSAGASGGTIRIIASDAAGEAQGGGITFLAGASSGTDVTGGSLAFSSGSSTGAAGSTVDFNASPLGLTAGTDIRDIEQILSMSDEYLDGGPATGQGNPTTAFRFPPEDQGNDFNARNFNIYGANKINGNGNAGDITLQAGIKSGGGAGTGNGGNIYLYAGDTGDPNFNSNLPGNVVMRCGHNPDDGIYGFISAENDIHLNGNQVVSLRAENSGSDPSTPALGQIYFNTGDMNFYGWNGTSWVQLNN